MKIKTLLAAGTIAWASLAHADLITFELGTGNTAIAGYDGPYAEVTVSLIDSTHATISFASLCSGTAPCSSGDQIFLFGGEGAVAVNVNADDFTLGTITGSNSGTGFTQTGPYSDGGAGNENGFGSFNQTITSFDGYTHSSDLITFSITNESDTWLSAAQVLALNSNNALAAAHIFVAAWPADASAGALATGFAAGNCFTNCDEVLPPQETPEPGMLSLISIALLGFGATAMRRRKA